jgi:excisionase family DNA binding protein
MYQNQKLISRKEAAKYLNVSAQTLAQWASMKRHGPVYYKIGRKVAYRPADLDAFIDRNVHYVGQLDHTGGAQ